MWVAGCGIKNFDLIAPRGKVLQISCSRCIIFINFDFYFYKFCVKKVMKSNTAAMKQEEEGELLPNC